MNDDSNSVVDALFSARESIRSDLRESLVLLDGVDEQCTAMFQISIGRLLDLGADRNLIRRGVEAVFAVDAALRQAGE